VPRSADPAAIIGFAVPIYEYKCSNGHVFEAVQSMADDPLTECEVCGAPVERVFHPIAVHFKGSGFYSTDYGSKKKSGQDGAKEEKSSKPDKKEPAKAKSDSGSGSDGGD
jgi:putative FmdB family regulatory protein